METSQETSCNIEVKISDLILTPLTCASLLAEMLKTLLYQKSQIPYPYNWLKTIVDKKTRTFQGSDNHKVDNFKVTKHFKTVSSAYKSIEQILCSLTEVIVNVNGDLKEVVIVFGVTPLCPKEVYTIKIPSIAVNHQERHHLNDNAKKQHKVLRDIFLSQPWMDHLDNSLSCTNTYVFLKLKTSAKFVNDNCFIPSKAPSFSPSTKHIIVNLDYLDCKNGNCCGDLAVFCDNEATPQKRNKPQPGTDKVTSGTEVWSQSEVLIQGFKDCFINKVSASELW